MIHEMKLQDVYFKKIANKEKIYEIRLNDEKRQLIKVHDTILFKSMVSGESINVKVVDLIHFKSFEEMANTLPATEIGFNDFTKSAIVDTYHEFYTAQDEVRYGVLAIKVDLQ